jgi:uncharacterized membrane protein
MSNKKSMTVQKSSQITTAEMYVGPIPPASEMQKYEEICPGLSNRIMAMAESQSSHRQQIELIVIKTSSRNSTLGVVFAFIIAIAFLLVGGFCIYLDKTLIGSLFGGVGLSAVVGAFIYGTRSNRAERQEKALLTP